MAITDYKAQYEEVLTWIQRSFKATGGRGSSAWFSYMSGWGSAYPETTGYLIESLLATGEPEYRETALQAGAWLLSLRRPDDSFPGGVGTQGEPVLFDTGMILAGFTALAKAESKGPWKETMLRCRQWLLSQLLDPQGWSNFQFHKGYQPTYEVLVLHRILQSAGLDALVPLEEDRVRQAFREYAQAFNAQSFPEHSGFREDEIPLTHTLAYSLEGFWHCARYFESAEVMEQVIYALRKILHLRRESGYLPGRIAPDWTAAAGYVCVTGNAQFSVLCRQVFDFTGEHLFADGAWQLFEDIAAAPRKRFIASASGGVPGSQPLWGPYFRGAFINWAAKYYVDAYLAHLAE